MFIFVKMNFRMTVRILVDIKFAWWIMVHLTWLFMAFIMLLGISLIPRRMFLLYFFFFLQNHNKDNHTRKKNYYKNRAIDDSHRVNWRISQQHSIWLIHACAGTGIGDDRFAIDNMNSVLIVRSFDWKLLL